MSSRAALLPYPGDPFLLNYWLKLYKKYWAKDIDCLYIGFNSRVEESVFEYIMEIINEASVETGTSSRIDVIPYMNDHGATLLRLLDLVKEEYVMLIEDDGFIFNDKIVGECFAKLESGQYDIVGSKRGSCSMEVLTAAQNKWNLQYEGEGDQGPNFWPNFFFCKTELLRRTDRKFGARCWYKGEVIEGLNYVVTDELANGDTFVNTSLQLRAMVSPERILCLPQYHGSPDDLDHYQRGKYLFDGLAPWTHVGSLSSGISGLLRDEYNRPLEIRLVQPKEEKTVLPGGLCTSEAEHKEFERRVQWWLTFLEAVDFESLSPKVKPFYLAYKTAVEQLIAQFELSISRIKKRQLVYSFLIKL